MIGTVLGERYRVTSAIATGAVGAVYEAEDERDGTRVAIKVLHPEKEDSAEAVARFEREAKTVALLDHPNIVRLLDHGTVDGKRFLVFELVTGSELRDLLVSRSIEPRRALAIVRQVLDALQHAHDRGVIHRDIKPENIMLAGEVVKVLDFGVAKLLDDTLAVLGDAKLTQTGFSVFGTPQYIAPECALGQPADHRLDIYSTGVVLFELLAGRTPFIGDDPVALLGAHASAARPTLAEAAPERMFTPALEYLVAESLAKEPKDRFSTARDMIAAIDRTAESLEPVPAEVEAPALAPVPPAPVAVPTPAASATTVQSPPPVATAPAPVVPAPPPVTAVPARPRLTKAQQKKVFIAGGAVFVVIVIIAIAASGGKGSQPGRAAAPAETPSRAAKASEPAPDLAKRAFDLIARGSAADAADLLEPALAVEPGRSDARAFVALGRARMALDRRAEAIGAYERAIVLDPELAHDTQIKLDAMKLLDSRDTIAGVIAVDFLATKVDPAARDVIIAAASNSKFAAIRHRALGVAQRDGFADGVDLISSWSLDLEQLPTCEERRAAVNRLRGTRDNRAVPMLRKLRTRFPCVTRDIDAAIAQLGGTSTD